jgi:hypothetical protein
MEDSANKDHATRRVESQQINIQEHLSETAGDHHESSASTNDISPLHKSTNDYFSLKKLYKSEGFSAIYNNPKFYDLIGIKSINIGPFCINSPVVLGTLTYHIAHEDFSWSEDAKRSISKGLVLEWGTGDVFLPCSYKWLCP